MSLEEPETTEWRRERTRSSGEEREGKKG